MTTPRTTFALPDLGEGLGEAEIVDWHVAVGDRIVADQPLLSVETDKAVVEIPAPHGGRIAALNGAVGDIVRVGDVLVEFAEADAAPPDRGAVVGELPQAPPAPPAATPPSAAKPSSAPAIKALPAARRLAAERGVDLRALGGTGPGGAITTADVEAAAGGRAAPGPGFEPLRGVRRAMAQAMTRSRDAVLPATVTDEADIDDWARETPVTPRLIRAVVAGVRAEPALNAWYDGASQSRRLNPKVDLGLAVDTADGLIVPVLRDVGGLDLAALDAAVAELSGQARARTIPPAALRGATVTLSNFGMIAGRHAMLAVIPPQVAILGVGRVEPRIVARAGVAVARRLVPLSLSFDHRAVSGGEAGRFVAAVIADLQSKS